MTEEHPHVFDPRDGCVFKDCKYYPDCSGHFGSARTYVPDIELLTQTNGSYSGGPGGAHVAGLVQCKSFEEKPE